MSFVSIGKSEVEEAPRTAQGSVVWRLHLLDQGGLSKQCLQLVARDFVLDGTGAVQHVADAPIALSGGEIRHDARAQVYCFADIERLTLTVFPEVDAGHFGESARGEAEGIEVGLHAPELEGVFGIYQPRHGGARGDYTEERQCRWFPRKVPHPAISRRAMPGTRYVQMSWSFFRAPLASCFAPSTTVVITVSWPLSTRTRPAKVSRCTSRASESTRCT